MKSGWLDVNSNQMWINFAEALKNFYNVRLKGILGIGLGKLGRNWKLLNYHVYNRASKLFNDSTRSVSFLVI